MMEGEALDEESKETEAQLWIPTTEVGGDQVVWYRVDCKHNGIEAAVHRRFRDFNSILHELKHSFKGSHLASSLPQLPPKEWKLLHDHADPTFIENRRAALEIFLRRMVRIPRTINVSTFRQFLGISEGVREYSVMFGAGPLGLTLTKTKSVMFDSGLKAVVTSFKDVDDQPGPAEGCGLILIGDVVSRVNGEAVISDPYEKIVEAMKMSKRPLVLHFVTPSVRGGAGGGGGGGGEAGGGGGGGGGDDGGSAKGEAGDGDGQQDGVLGAAAALDAGSSSPKGDGGADNAGDDDASQS